MDANRYGISTWICRSLSLEKSLAVLREHGYRLLEVWADTCHLDPRVKPDVPGFARQVRDAGCSVHSLHAPFTDLGDRAVDLHARTFEIGAELGATTCVVHLPRAQPPAAGTTTENLEAARRFVEQILGPAEGAGLRITLENLPRRNDADCASTLASLVREFPDPRIGFCLDVGHVLINGADMHSEIAAAAGRLRSLHLSSNDRASDRHWPPGRGALDWAGTRRALSSVGYEGPYILEIQGGDDPVGVLRELRNDRSIT